MVNTPLANRPILLRGDGINYLDLREPVRLLQDLLKRAERSRQANCRMGVLGPLRRQRSNGFKVKMV
ncbi:MAG: hypothetical protein LRZ84_23635 [Desertifilum sp.]|nr:hypothetical protein [Desertifilum sp.]